MIPPCSVISIIAIIMSFLFAMFFAQIDQPCWIIQISEETNALIKFADIGGLIEVRGSNFLNILSGNF